MILWIILSGFDREIASIAPGGGGYVLLYFSARPYISKNSLFGVFSLKIAFLVFFFGKTTIEPTLSIFKINFDTLSSCELTPLASCPFSAMGSFHIFVLPETSVFPREQTGFLSQNISFTYHVHILYDVRWEIRRVLS